jgi:hypothetical protein
MNLYSTTPEATEPSSKMEAVVRYQGKFTEVQAVRILASRGVFFSKIPGKARNETPIAFLTKSEEVPTSLKYVVLPKGILLGNRAWGKIDFLVNYCDYTLIDERR